MNLEHICDECGDDDGPWLWQGRWLCSDCLEVWGYDEARPAQTGTGFA